MDLPELVCKYGVEGFLNSIWKQFLYHRSVHRVREADKDQACLYSTLWGSYFWYWFIDGCSGSHLVLGEY